MGEVIVWSILLVGMLITGYLAIRMKYKRNVAIVENKNLKSTISSKDNALEWRQRDLDELKAEKETEWKRLQDRAKEEAEANVEYDLGRAQETEERLICANKDLHDVIAEMRNLFAKTQQQSASDTVKALVPWAKEEKELIK